jgi:iron complex outermembrane recepter protein
MTHSGNIDLNGKFERLGSKHNLLIGVDSFHATTEAASKSGPAASIDIFAPYMDSSPIASQDCQK